MRQSARCPSRRRARRGIGISTAFFRPDFKGGRARSRTCVRGRRWKWTSAFAESLCTRFAERRRFPVFRLRNRTDQFSASERDRKRKGSPAVRSKEKWPLDPACRGSRPWLENRASIGIVTTETRPLSSFLLSSEQRRRWREINSPFDRPIHTGSRIVNRQRT